MNNKGVVLSNQWTNLKNLDRIKKFIRNYERKPGLRMILTKIIIASFWICEYIINSHSNNIFDLK